MKKIITSALALLPILATAQGSWQNYTKANSAIPSNKVYALGIGFGSKVWTGTNAGMSTGLGLSFFSGAYFQPINRSGTGLIYDIIEHGGQTWVLTGDSLMVFGESIYNYRGYAPDASTGVSFLAYANPLVRTSNNFFWMKPDGYKGLLAFDPSPTAAPSNRWKIINTSNSALPTDSIVHIAAQWGTGNYNVYAATTDKGLVKFDGISFTSYNTSNSSIPSNSINLVELDKSGTVWMIIGDDKLVSFDGASTFTTYTSDSLKNASVIRAGNDSTLWIGSPSGLIKFRNGAFTYFNTANSPLSDNDVLNIRIDESNNIWIGTFSGGLNIYNESGSITLGLEAAKPAQLNIYPNPAGDNVQVSCPETIKKITLYDMQGRKVTAEINGNRIKLTGIAPGIYTVEAKTDNHILRQKLVKQ